MKRIIALGNYNNLAWFTLYNLAENCQIASTLVIRECRKLRDEPLLDHALIQVLRCSVDDVTSIEKIASELDGRGIFILSGNYIFYAPLIRKLNPGSVIIYYVIGFELEGFIFHGQSEKIENFISLMSMVDFIQFQDQWSPPLRRLMLEAGADKKALPYSRMLHVLRPRLIDKLLTVRVPSRELVTRFDNVSRDGFNIFWASRITGESASSHSMNNKGFEIFAQDLKQWLEKNMDCPLSLTVVQRDHVSKELTDRLEMQLICHSKFSIVRLQELDYVDFCYALSRCGVAIDTYSPSGGLRANMTTSDAISVGGCVSSSFDPTIHSTLLSDTSLKLKTSSELFQSLHEYSVRTHSEAREIRAFNNEILDRKYVDFSEFAERNFFNELYRVLR